MIFEKQCNFNAFILHAKIFSVEVENKTFRVIKRHITGQFNDIYLGMF